MRSRASLLSAAPLIRALVGGAVYIAAELARAVDWSAPSAKWLERRSFVCSAIFSLTSV